MKRWTIIILIAVGIAIVLGAGLYIYFGTNLIIKEVTISTYPVFVSPSSYTQDAVSKKNEALCNQFFYPEKIMDCRLEVLRAKGLQPEILMCDSIPNNNQTVLYVFKNGSALTAITGYDYCVISVSHVLQVNYCSKITNSDIKQTCDNYLKVYPAPAG